MWLRATHGDPPWPSLASQGIPECFIHKHLVLIQESPDMWRLGREVSHSSTHGEILRAMENCFYLTGSRSEVWGRLGKKETTFGFHTIQLLYAIRATYKHVYTYMHVHKETYIFTRGHLYTCVYKHMLYQATARPAMRIQAPECSHLSLDSLSYPDSGHRMLSLSFPSNLSLQLQASLK